MNDQQSSIRPGVTLSPGTSRDLDAVITIMDAAFDDRFGEAWTRSQCAGILPMPGVRLVVARLDGDAPAGFSLSRMLPAMPSCCCSPFRRSTGAAGSAGHCLAR